MGKYRGGPQGRRVHEACGAQWMQHTVSVPADGKPVWRCPPPSVEGLRADRIIVDEVADLQAG